MSVLLTLNTGKYLFKLANKNFVELSKVNDKDTRKSTHFPLFWSAIVANLELFMPALYNLLDHPSDSETVNFHNFK